MLWLEIGWHFPTVGNGDLNIWTIVRPAAGVFNLSYNIHTIDDMTKHDMFTIEVWSVSSSDEELASVCPRPCLTVDG